MTAPAVAPMTEWHIAGQDIGIGNFACGWPCQFNALPTTGFCEAVGALDIQHGHFGDTSLDGLRFVQVFHWDGPVHEGSGWRRLLHDEKSSPEQRAAVEAFTSGTQRHAFFEIFAAMAPNALEPMVAPIELTYDHQKRQARLALAHSKHPQPEGARV